MDSSLHALMWSAGSLAGTGLLMAAFSVIGKIIFKQDALGWGDVKYMMAIAACLGPKGHRPGRTTTPSSPAASTASSARIFERP